MDQTRERRLPVNDKVKFSVLLSFVRQTAIRRMSVGRTVLFLPKWNLVLLLSLVGATASF